jgi:hypothetical protein
MAWDPDHIDSISEYCDRWCERCPLTHKCASFTRDSDPEELEACTDAVEGAMEKLAVELTRPEPAARPWLDEILHAPPPTEEERRELDREHEERRRRVRMSPMMIAAHDYSIDAFTWLRLYGAATRERAESALAQAGDSPETAVLRMEAEGVLEALQVANWDSMLIAAKLWRALGGQADGAEPCGDNPAQTDFNGSAKLTLLLTERSEASWRLIVPWAPESAIATKLAHTLASLRADIERAFPGARRFIRPGFDEMPS